jgi:hypothetical protein
MHSISTARLAHIVIQGLGGAEAGRKTKLSELLPFTPQELFGNKVTDCKERTLKALGRLIKTGKLPPFIIPVVKDEIDAIK